MSDDIAKKSRKLMWAATDAVTYWKCGACGWTRPVPTFNGSDYPDMDTKIAFGEHQCEKYPLIQKLRTTL